MPIGKREIGDIKLSMAQERAVGRIVAAWSDLEQAMELLIWELFDVDMEHGKIITKRLSTDARMQMLRALGKLHFEPEPLKVFSRLLDRINDLKEDRNFVAHGTWFQNDSGVPCSASTRPKSEPFTVVVEAFPPERLRNLNQDIKTAMGHFGSWLPSMQNGA